MTDKGIRTGEAQLGFDPAAQADATVAFIGHICSPWQPGEAPRNVRQARERGCDGARIELAPGYGAALTGLAVGQAIWVLTWMDRSRRDLALQKPGHADGPRARFPCARPRAPIRWPCRRCGSPRWTKPQGLSASTPPMPLTAPR